MFNPGDFSVAGEEVGDIQILKRIIYREGELYFYYNDCTM